MPTRSTVHLWVLKHKDFSDQYARARELQMEVWSEEIIEIADDAASDKFTDANGNERVDNEHINRSRLRVDTRKWLMSKLAPKKYGDKVDLRHAGEDGGPLKIEIVRFADVKAG